MSDIRLEIVKDKITHWRETRDKFGAIPKNIWEDIVKLCSDYPRGEICKELKISGQQLKTKLSEQSHDERVNFVEIADEESTNQPLIKPPDIPTCSKNTSSRSSSSNIKVEANIGSSYPVEFSRSDGATIKLNLSQGLLLDVLNNFWRNSHVTNNA